MHVVGYNCMVTQMSKKASTSPSPSGCGTRIVDCLRPEFFKALCDPNRIAILIRLAQCCEPCTVSQIAACCPINVSVVSRHLAMLRDAGILDARKQGKEVRYSVRYATLVTTLRSMADAIEACCPAENANVNSS